MIVTVCSSGGGGGCAAQQAQRVGGFLDACVDSVNCLLEYVETGLEQGGLGCQRHTGSGRVGVFAMVMSWHHASFCGSSRESYETGVGADGHKTTVRWGHSLLGQPAAGTANRMRSTQIPAPSAVREPRPAGTGSPTTRPFAPPRYRGFTTTTDRAAGSSTLHTPRKRPPRAPADLTKGTEAPSPEARGKGPSAVGRPPRTDCLPVLRALDRALPQRRPNALITVW